MQRKKSTTPLNEKRLLSVDDFQEYASIGRNNAFRLIKEANCGIWLKDFKEKSVKPGAQEVFSNANAIYF